MKDIEKRLRVAIGYDNLVDVVESNNEAAIFINVNTTTVDLSRDEVWAVVYSNLRDDIGITAIAAYVAMLEMYGSKVSQTLMSARDMLVNHNEDEVAKSMEEHHEVIKDGRYKVKGELH